MASEPISTAEAPAAFQTHHALGNLIRLYPLTLGEVPNHPQFANVPQTPKAMQESSTHPEIVPFLRAVLAEASTFIDTTVPSTFVKKQLKASKPAVAKVQLLQRTITPEELAQVPWTTSKLPRHVDPAKAAAKMEPWFARRSRHSNQSEDGTADYPEFDAGLRVEHSVKERMYTPNVFDSYKVLDWDADTKGLDIGDGWRDVDMSSKSFFGPAAHVLLAVKAFTRLCPYLRPRSLRNVPQVAIAALPPCLSSPDHHRQNRSTRVHRCADSHRRLRLNGRILQQWSKYRRGQDCLEAEEAGTGGIHQR